jgi:hypothetical protein
MNKVKITFNVDDEGNILNLLDENLFNNEFHGKITSNNVKHKNDFIINFINDLNGWSRTIIKGVNFAKKNINNIDSFNS